MHGVESPENPPHGSAQVGDGTTAPPADASRLVEHVVIRANASVRTGTGHVMRCLALAEAWQCQGGSATFVTGPLPEPLQARLRESRLELLTTALTPGGLDDADFTARIAAERDAGWIVSDGYAFHGAFQRHVQQRGARLLVVDDFGSSDRYDAQLVLNQNPNPPQAWYRQRRPDTRLLLGTRYALLRSEFLRHAAERKEPRPTPHRLLVTLGGSDPDNATAWVLESLEPLRHDRLQVRVLIGAANPHGDTLRALAKRLTYPLEWVVDCRDMPAQLAWADLAISAGGSTCWELACLGVPHLILILADNQEHIARQLDDPAGCVNLGWFGICTSAELRRRVSVLLGDRPLLARLADLGRTRVDGRGASRVVRAMLNVGAAVA